jgi:diacylglycerol kinase (ATP)
MDAFRYSMAGFKRGIATEVALRQALFAFAVLVPLSVLLPVSTVEHLILVLSMMLAVLAELVNSAIESTVDCISLERHPLAGQAKDYASAAVFVALMMSALCWVVIAGPVVSGWLRSQ